MLRPLLIASIGEKFLTRLITASTPLNAGISTMSAAECPAWPVSSLPAATEPESTDSASVSPDNPTTSMASAKKVATGNDRKLAAIKPNAASSAIQQKMMPSPRAKFSAKPPSGYKTSMPSSSGKSRAVLFGFANVIVNTPAASNKSGGISNSWNVSGARLIGSLRQNCVFSGTPTCHMATNVPDGLFCAELNFTRSWSGFPRR